MARSRQVWRDETASTALSNDASQVLLERLTFVLPDERDRVLVVGHYGLQLPTSTLARRLEMARREAEARLERARVSLRDSGTHLEWLGELSRVGQLGHYQPLLFRLGLLDWFCSWCGGEMPQLGVGRTRKTCSPTCKRRLNQAGGRGWKDAHQPGARPAREDEVHYTPAEREQLRTLVRAIETRDAPSWRAVRLSRDRALLLLGFNSPIALAPADLSALNVDDVGFTQEGLQVHFFKGARGRQPRYVTIPKDPDPMLCPVRAMTPWLSVMRRAYQFLGPLFVNLSETYEVPYPRKRMGRKAIAGVVDQAWWYWREPLPEFPPSMLFPDFLHQRTPAEPTTASTTDEASSRA